MDVLNLTASELALGLLAGIFAVGVATFAVICYALLTAKRPAVDGERAGSLLEKLANEPVRVRTAVLGILTVLGSFGLPVSDAQQGAIVAAVLGILVLFSETTRAKVSPVRDGDG